MNRVVQIYACEALFYRTERPELDDDFRKGQHLHFTSLRNFVETIVHDMPGVPDRDTTLDFFEDMMAGR